MTATGTGDVDPGLTMPDPAKEAPLKAVAVERFGGRYNKSITGKDGQKAHVLDHLGRWRCFARFDLRHDGRVSWWLVPGRLGACG